MENEQYLDSIQVTGEARERCLAAMEKWGGNRWWLPEADLRALGYYQTLEPIMLISDFGQYHKAIEELLGRPVYTWEFGICAEQLTQEVTRAWESGVGCTDEERKKRVCASITAMAEYASANDKEMLIIQVDE